MKWLCFLLMILLLLSCKSNGKKDIEPDVKSFLGSIAIVNRDIEQKISASFVDKDYILIIYLEIEDCMPCILDNVNLLKIYQSDFDKFKTGVLLIIQDSDKNNEINSIIEELDIHYPVFFDKGDSFRDSNKSMNHKVCHTFIMNKDYEVIWIGSPIKNEQSLIRYREMMNLLLK